MPKHRQKSKIEQRAADCYKIQQEAFEAQSAGRQGQLEIGNKLRCKKRKPPRVGPGPVDQVNLTNDEPCIMPISGGGFKQS